MKSIAKNYLLNLIYQVLVIILPLITAPYLARVLGADRIGEYSFAQSIVSYFALAAAMGTALYGQRSIAQCTATHKQYRQTFLEIVALRVVGVGVALGVYYFGIMGAVDNKLLYAMAALEILAVAFDISWFFQGVEQFQNITVCNGITKVLGAAAIFVFVKDRADLEWYVLLYCGATVLGNMAQWLFVGPYLRAGAGAKLQIRRHVMPALKLFASQFAIQAYTVLDKTMIGLITKSDFENGYYEQSQKIIKILVAMVTAIGTVMASRIAILWNSDETDKDRQIRDLLLFSFRLVFALALPIAVGITLIASRFVPVFFGEGYEPVVGLIQLLSVIVPIIGCSNIIGIQLFVPSGREHLLTRSVLIGAAVNVAMNSVLIRYYGAAGAVAASIVAEASVTGVQFYCARKEVPLSGVAKLFVRYMLLAALMGAAGGLVSMHVGADALGMVIIVAVCVPVYAGALLVLRDPMVGFLLNRSAGNNE